MAQKSLDNFLKGNARLTSSSASNQIHLGSMRQLEALNVKKGRILKEYPLSRRYLRRLRKGDARHLALLSSIYGLREKVDLERVSQLPQQIVQFERDEQQREAFQRSIRWLERALRLRLKPKMLLDRGVIQPQVEDDHARFVLLETLKTEIERMGYDFRQFARIPQTLEYNLEAFREFGWLHPSGAFLVQNRDDLERLAGKGGNQFLFNPDSALPIPSPGSFWTRFPRDASGRLAQNHVYCIGLGLYSPEYLYYASLLVPEPDQVLQPGPHQPLVLVQDIRQVVIAPVQIVDSTDTVIPDLLEKEDILQAIKPALRNGKRAVLNKLLEELPRNPALLADIFKEHTPP